MTGQEQETKKSASLLSAAEPQICEDCRMAFYQRIGIRADQLSDLVMDYELEWANTLNLDIDKFLEAEFEESEQVAKAIKDYAILQDFIMAFGALMEIKKKLGGK